MESWPCGPHLLELEEPDILHCRVRGVIEEEHARETVRVGTEELGKKRGIRVFFIAHLEEAGSNGTFTSAARKYIGTSRLDWQAIIVVGGNPLIRLAAGIIARAVGMLSSSNMPTVMAKDMDEAREFIAQTRNKAARPAREASAGR